MASSVAVLGGGISGLSAAYYLARVASPSTKILLIEGSDRVGGWIQSRRVSPGVHTKASPTYNVQEGNKDNTVLFEAGPRSLRPQGSNGAILLEMIQHLHLKNDSLFSVPKTDPSVQHRYIYYKDSINTLPSSLSSLLINKPPIFKSVLLAGMLEPFKASRFDKHGQPKNNMDDESIYDFMSRRFNKHTALNLMGAVTHGIYAGDVKQLSLKSTFRMLYEAERNYGGVVKGMMKGASHTATMRERGMAVRSREADPAWFDKMEKMSVIGFKQGLEILPSQILQFLKECRNVEVVTGQPIASITPANDECKIKTKDKEYHVNHVISTLPSHKLNEVLPGLPNLTHNPSADVAVINLAYQDIKLPYDGFGFLTPHRDTPTPVPGTLGVIFDSNALPSQEPFTKLTAMLGGSDWNDVFSCSIDQLDPHQAYEKSLEVMNKYLQIDSQPSHAMINLQKACIPQYIVGHDSRMQQLHFALQGQLGHLLSVSGASYLGVSVPDCIKHSRMLVEELCVSGALGKRQKVVTGLEKTIGMTSQEMKDAARLSKGNVNVIMES